ncbi:hypothetical protein EVAR_10028_1 [Eumeta japonica]|uniref:Uncharacterized protein n=1 Tax=Eumeta variegata TaxID=151549 RepID=A0A4C1TR33_EUMVA|nr:hypothetical protein EVAR_10028_1 [Eumeta japonica]
MSSYDSPLLMLTQHYLKNSEGTGKGENMRAKGQSHMVDTLTIPNQTLSVFIENVVKYVCDRALSWFVVSLSEGVAGNSAGWGPAGKRHLDYVASLPLS